MTPTGPRTLKGAIIAMDPMNPVASTVVFQYNPAELTRTITPQMEGGERGSRAETVRFTGAPVEEFTVQLDIDATDQLATGTGTAAMLGIYPQLSALEMIAYPKSAVVIANTILLATGTIEIVPLAAPLTLFVWGPKRVLPVKLVSYSITEQAYDVNLNPIRAEVSASFRVLTYSDLPLSAPGYSLYLANQVAKEVMAVMGSVTNATAITGVAM